MAPSLSIFFPCYNDEGTIASMVVKADAVARSLTSDYEIIVVDDGSRDHSREILEELKRKYDRLRVVLHPENRGYGGALRSGFANATKDLVFYTDGDAQYDVYELKKLYPLMIDGVDAANGYKIKRSDPFYRVWFGLAYQYGVKLAFGLKIRDVDCDFRLMRRKIFDKVQLTRTSGVICVEMVKKIQMEGFKFAEIGVHHFFRAYGRSQFFNFSRLFRVMINLVALWAELVLFARFRK